MKLFIKKGRSFKSGESRKKDLIRNYRNLLTRNPGKISKKMPSFCSETSQNLAYFDIKIPEINFLSNFLKKNNKK
jgi:hypothetical protein